MFDSLDEKFEPEHAVGDAEIRFELLRRFRDEFASNSDTRIIEELSLCQGEARVDVAVINGHLSGFEIKSDRDRLCRLINQREVYNRCLEEVTIVSGSSHLSTVESEVPEWWGIWLVQSGAADVTISVFRRPQRNPEIDVTAVVQLLWRQEALSALEKCGCARGVRSKPREVIWRHLADSMPKEELLHCIRETVRTRGGWRHGCQQK